MRENFIKLMTQAFRVYFTGTIVQGPLLYYMYNPNLHPPPSWPLIYYPPNQAPPPKVFDSSLFFCMIVHVNANVWAMCFISIIFCCYTVIVELREPPGAFVLMQWFTTVVSEGETVLLVSTDNVISLQSSKL